jgi:hypothetical protein
MKKLDLNTVPDTIKPSKMVIDLPENLKDVKYFKKIEKELFTKFTTGHKHKTVKSYVKCEPCQEMFMKRRERIKELGFKSIQQYQLWKKIMTIINNKSSFQLR